MRIYIAANIKMFCICSGQKEKGDCYNEVRRVPLTWPVYSQKLAVSVVRVVINPIAVVTLSPTTLFHEENLV